MDAKLFVMEKRIAELEAELSKIKSILPETYYSDRILPERVELMVKSWQKLIPILSEADERIAELEEENDEFTTLRASNAYLWDNFNEAEKRIEELEAELRAAKIDEIEERTFEGRIEIDDDGQKVRSSGFESILLKGAMVEMVSEHNAAIDAVLGKK